ncbi:MAG: CPCC family cysteine-rich protein [Bryobacteraceae bacterium]
MKRTFPCHCCGFLTLSEPGFGTFEICAVCFWEDDPVQNEDPSFAGGANRESLNEARRNYIDHGAAELACVNDVRAPRLEEVPRSDAFTFYSGDHSGKARMVLLGVVRAILAEQISPLAGSAAAASVAATLETQGTLGDALRVFRAVAGEIDGMPTGKVRQEWSAHALAVMDDEYRDYEQRVRASVLEACRLAQAAPVEEPPR